ncbi:MAG: hypothetical protein ABJ327_17925 [Litoreibacter sp.]
MQTLTSVVSPYFDEDDMAFVTEVNRQMLERSVLQAMNDGEDLGRILEANFISAQNYLEQAQGLLAVYRDNLN